MKSFSLVMPCYNEAQSLPALVKRAVDCAKKRCLAPNEFELVLVENGSKDNSFAVMESLKKDEDGSYLKIVRVLKNEGYGNGLFQGLKATCHEVVGYTHADEQCDPDDVFQGWALISKQPGKKVLIKGTRHERAFRDRVISRGFELIASALFLTNLHEINAQPKVFSAELLSVLTQPPKDFAFDLYILLQAKQHGYRFLEIPVLFPPRKHGQSNWASTFRSKTRTILKMLGYMFRYRLKLI